MKDGITNLSASVHARLLNKAKAENRPFQELLQYYGMERFLHRLSKSPHRASFVLKGALMLQFWGAELTRSTKDIDLLGRDTRDVDELIAVIGDCIESDVEDDGLTFDHGNVSGVPIRIAAGYAGVRITFRAQLGKARIPLQVDVGFGDALSPEPTLISYPSLLDPTHTELLGYAPETAMAEKLEAMVVLELANSRLKDYFDIWTLARSRSFNGRVLGDAIEATFKSRRAPLPSTLPLGLSNAFVEAPGKKAQWTGWLRRSRAHPRTPELSVIVDEVRMFIEPVLMRLATSRPLPLTWPPGGPWSYPSEDGQVPAPTGS